MLNEGVVRHHQRRRHGEHQPSSSNVTPIPTHILIEHGAQHHDRDRLVFIEVGEAKTEKKNRVHLDLLVGEGSEGDEVARLEALGAKVVDDRRKATPEGGSLWPTRKATSSVLKDCRAIALAQRTNLRSRGTRYGTPAARAGSNTCARRSAILHCDGERATPVLASPGSATGGQGMRSVGRVNPSRPGGGS